MVTRAYSGQLDHSQKLLFFFENIYSETVNKVSFGLSKIMDIIVIIKMEDYTNHTDIFKQLQTYFKVVNQYSKFFNDLISSCIKKQGAGLDYFSDNQIFMKLMYQLLSWVTTVEEQPQHIIMSLTNDQYMNDILNETKYHSLSAINDMLPLAIKKKNEAFIQTNFLYMNYCLITLCYLNQRDDIDIIMSDLHCKNLINALITNINISVDCYSYAQLLSGMKMKVYFEIIFPFLMSSETEKEQFEKNPTEYQGLLIDTCEDQRSDIIKTNAAKLLFKFVSKVDGSATMIGIINSQIL